MDTTGMDTVRDLGSLETSPSLTRHGLDDGALQGLVGTRVGPVTLETLIARSETRGTFLARMPGHDGAVCVELWRRPLGAGARRRWLDQTRPLLHARDEGLPSVLATGTLDHPCGVLPWWALDRVVDLPTLAQVGSRWSHRERVEALHGAATAVAALHRRGVAHGALRPDAYRIDENGETLVVDAGLARALASEASPVSIPAPVSASWMSPEHRSGDAFATDPRSDVWSLGTGIREILATTRKSLVVGRKKDATRGLHPDLVAIIEKCRRRDPELRYAHAGEVADELRRWLSKEPVLARPRAARPSLRSVATWAVILGLLGSFSLAARQATDARWEARRHHHQWKVVSQDLHRANAETRRLRRSLAGAEAGLHRLRVERDRMREAADRGSALAGWIAETILRREVDPDAAISATRAFATENAAVGDALLLLSRNLHVLESRTGGAADRDLLLRLWRARRIVADSLRGMADTAVQLAHDQSAFEAGVRAAALGGFPRQDRVALARLCDRTARAHLALAAAAQKVPARAHQVDEHLEDARDWTRRGLALFESMRRLSLEERAEFSRLKEALARIRKKLAGY